MSKVLYILCIMTPSLVHAAGGHGEGVPNVVYWQIFNLAILFSVIFYFTKKPVQQAFQSRQKEFNEKSQKTAHLRMAAEEKLKDIQNRLNELEITKDDVINKAKQQAEQIKAQLHKESQEQAKKILDEAMYTSKLSWDRARSDLKLQITNQAIEKARTMLANDTGAQDKQRLQNEFAGQVEACSL